MVCRVYQILCVFELQRLRLKSVRPSSSPIEKKLPKIKWHELYDKWDTITEENPHIMDDELEKQIKSINSILRYQGVSPANFAREVVAILSKSKGKKNTIWITGEGNEGKSILVRAIAKMMCFSGDVSQSKNFYMQSLVGKTFIHFKDFNIQKMGKQNVKVYKDLMEGNPTTVDVPIQVQAPVIVTTSTRVEDLLAELKENECSKKAFKTRLCRFKFPKSWHNLTSVSSTQLQSRRVRC